MSKTLAVIWCIALSIFARGAQAMVARERETEQASRWAQRWLGTDGSEPEAPFSFTCGGRHSDALLKTWKLDRSTRRLDSARTGHTLTYADPATGLAVRLEAILYADYPAVEWVVYLKNDGREDTPILGDVYAVNATVERRAGAEVVVNYAVGSPSMIDDYAPREQRLPSAALRLASHWGHSSFEYLPFFNVNAGGEGAVVAVGWSGQWVAEFERREDAVSLRAGMDYTRLRLHPREEIRTPRVLLLFWQGDRLRGHNLLRSFILAHHTPAPTGKQLMAPIAWGSWGGEPVQKHKENARYIADNRLPIEYYWIDAEWFGKGGWGANVGNWYHNSDFYPNGLKELGDFVHALGMKFLVWYEPERVYQGTWLAREHPEWVIGDGENRMFHLGDPQARRWLTDFLSRQISEAGIDCFRMDSNMDLALFWRQLDTVDRQGIAQIRHVEGLYELWDELLARHPGLVIDNCSSGGRRIDLETISRSIPLWRSDYQCTQNFDPIGSQCQTYGLSFWVPLSACGIMREGDLYSFRSGMSAGACTNWREPDVRFPFEWARHMLEQAHACRPYFYGDYYPLTPYSTADDTWMAYQFHREDLGAGMVLAFRRPQSAEQSLTLRLHGLAREQDYEVEFVDSGVKRPARGGELAEGLKIQLPTAPGAELIIYRRR